MNNIKFIKMSNGDMLIGQLVKDDLINLVFKTVACIFYVQSKGGQPGVQLMPYAPFTDEENIPLPKSHILFCLPANQEMAQMYKQATGQATIITPKGPGIIT